MTCYFPLTAINEDTSLTCLSFTSPQGSVSVYNASLQLTFVLKEKFIYLQLFWNNIYIKETSSYPSFS